MPDCKKLHYTMGYLYAIFILILINGLGGTCIQVPDLPTSFYPYWLRNNLKASVAFKSLCNIWETAQQQVDSKKFIELYESNGLSYESEFDLNTHIELVESICKSLDNVNKKCWGYENNCYDIYLMPECNLSILNSQQPSTSDNLLKEWFMDFDFGIIIKMRRDSVRYCLPTVDTEQSSFFECVKTMSACRGTNLQISFEDGIEINGVNCDFQSKRLAEERDDPNVSQTWYKDLSKYQIADKGDVNQSHCDIRVDGNVILARRAENNPRDQICNLLNIYTTMHLYNSFSQNNKVIIWEQNTQSTLEYSDVYRAFTNQPINNLNSYHDKKVCLDKFIFSLQPREGPCFMDKSISECNKTGLHESFNKFMMHRLGIKQDSDNTKINRILLIENNNSPLNNNMTLRVLEQLDVKVKTIKFSDVPTSKEIEQVYNSDILIGSGVELFYSLFLPDWATVIDMSKNSCKKNLGDCYENLARVRGIRYIRAERKQLAFILKDLVKQAPKSITSTRTATRLHQTSTTTGPILTSTKTQNLTSPTTDSSIKLSTTESSTSSTITDLPALHDTESSPEPNIIQTSTSSTTTKPSTSTKTHMFESSTIQTSTTSTTTRPPTLPKADSPNDSTTQPSIQPTAINRSTEILTEPISAMTQRPTLPTTESSLLSNTTQPPALLTITDHPGKPTAEEPSEFTVTHPSTLPTKTPLESSTNQPSASSTTTKLSKKPTTEHLSELSSTVQTTKRISTTILPSVFIDESTTEETTSTTVKSSSHPYQDTKSITKSKLLPNTKYLQENAQSAKKPRESILPNARKLALFHRIKNHVDTVTYKDDEDQATSIDNDIIEDNIEHGLNELESEKETKSSTGNYNSIRHEEL